MVADSADLVCIQEVGMRDGLQSAGQFVTTEDKVRLIDQLSKTGLSKIEVTSFVSPKAVPLLADAEEVLAAINRQPSVTYSALIPNRRGLDRALAVELDEVNLVMSVSEAHNLANLRMTCEQSIEQFREICNNRGSLRVNGTLATAFGCPFHGEVTQSTVFEWAHRYLDAGIDSLTLADTIGAATPRQVYDLCSGFTEAFPSIEITLHLHNTRGLGIANALSGIAAGIRHLDASIGGIGGCPYAPGATGNVCTEDLVHALIFDGYRCEVDLEQLLSVSHELGDLLSDPLPGLVRYAGSKLTKHPMSEDLRYRMSLVGQKQ
jgi:hydroxymethylglutaryl-CoA lyase